MILHDRLAKFTCAAAINQRLKCACATRLAKQRLPDTGFNAARRIAQADDRPTDTSCDRLDDLKVSPMSPV